jgi:hypothetical protein
MRKSKIIRIITIVLLVIAISSFVIGQCSAEVELISNYCSIISAVFSIISYIVNFIIDKSKNEFDGKKIILSIFIFFFIALVLGVAHVFEVNVIVSNINGNKSNFRFHTSRQNVKYCNIGDTIYVKSVPKLDFTNWKICNEPRKNDTVISNLNKHFREIQEIQYRNVIIEKIDYSYLPK